MKRHPLLLAACLLAAPSAARAAEGDAESLFVQGNALVKEGKFAEACPKLAESERLEPALGTRFNLADCYEHIGRTATAHGLFLDVAKAAHAAGKFERENLAKQRANTLTPRLARIRLDVKSTAPGLEVHLDGAVVPRVKWHDEQAVDLGSHRVSATAEGRTPIELEAAAREGGVVVITLPELVGPTAETAPPASRPPGSSRRTLAYGLGGIGLAGVAVGVIAGAVALSGRSSAEDACPEATYHFRCPTQNGAEEWSSARTAGTVATVGFIAGGVALAAAVVVWLTVPSARTSASRPGVWTF